MKRRGSVAGWVVVLTACIAWHVEAGTVIQQEEREPGSNKPGQQMTIYVDAGKLRIEGEDPTTGKYTMIFDQSKQVLWMVDVGKGTYTELTAAEVQGMGQQMQQAMKEMEAELANMPPEQRKMVEQMMKGPMGGAAGGAPKATVREKGRGEKVGQFVCIHYEVLTGEQLSQEVWAAPASQVQLEDAAYQTFRALSQFYEPLSRQAPKGAWAVPGGQQIDGFPVRTILYQGQKPVSESVVVKVEKRALEAGLFTLPSGLKKTQMPSQ